jgi:hypothetical protein
MFGGCCFGQIELGGRVGVVKKMLSFDDDAWFRFCFYSLLVDYAFVFYLCFYDCIVVTYVSAFLSFFFFSVS